MFTGAAGAEIVNDSRCSAELAGGVGPSMGTVAFLRPWSEHLNRCLIGVEEQEVLVRQEFGDGEMMPRAIQDGCGLCQLPTWLVEDHLRSGALVTVLDNYAGATMPIHVIWPRTRYIQPKVRVVVDALLKMAAEQADVFGAS